MPSSSLDLQRPSFQIRSHLQVLDSHAFWGMLFNSVHGGSISIGNGDGVMLMMMTIIVYDGSGGGVSIGDDVGIVLSQD